MNACRFNSIARGWQGLAAVLVVAAIAGCQADSRSSTATASNAASVERPEVARDMTAGKAAIQASPATGRRKSTSAANPKSAKDKLDYQPPYPNRTDMFALPRSLANKGPSVLNHRPGPARFIVKGFVNVGRPQVLLAIDGEIAALGVGEERGGAKVVEIAPPQVTFERGRRRWTQSLLDRDA